MSKRDLKKYVNELTKEQLEENSRIVWKIQFCQSIL
jgi:hypothetical protein